MNHGSLPRSILRSLPAGQIEPNHTPDGLAEADIDALAAEAGIDLEPLVEADEQAATVVPLWPATHHPVMPFGDEAA